MSPAVPLSSADEALLVAVLGLDAAASKSALKNGAELEVVHAHLKARGGIVIATLDAFQAREEQASARHALLYGQPGFSDKTLVRELDLGVRGLRQEASDTLHVVLKASREVELDLNRPHRGFPAIVLASQQGLGEVVSDLVKHGADPNVRTGLRSTALHQAARQMRVGVMRRLAGLSVDLDAQDDHGRTPAHAAGNEGHVLAMRELKRLGANLALKNKTGQTAADELRSHGEAVYQHWVTWEGAFEARHRANRLEETFNKPVESPRSRFRF